MLLLAPLLWILSCSSREQLVAGGDDMGNFVQAILLDSTGAPLHGRVQVVSESDTFS